MKVGLLIHDLNNLGGIITYVERLAKGLIENGHDVDILKLLYSERTTGNKPRNPGYEPGTTDVLVHPIYGWSFPNKNRVPYKGKALASAIEKLNQYDVLIWETPSPSMPVNREKRHNMEWMELFKNSAKQVITIHDGNLMGMYPHLMYALRGINNVTATAPHPRGFEAAKHLGIDTTMIMIPQYPPDETITFKQKRRGFFACQIFKAWKHVDEPIRAISYMKPKSKSYCKVRSIAGTGMHYYYMTSQKKCKYYHPDYALSELRGQRIWNTALAHGMKYLGVVNFEQRDREMAKTLLFLDSSWVNDGGGNHLNGAVAESLRLGCIPVGKPLTFRSAEDDYDAIYQPGQNYLEIPQYATDLEYAECLEEFSHTSKTTWDRMNWNNQEILRKKFDYRQVANQLLTQATKGVGLTGVPHFIGDYPSEELKVAANKMIQTFFDH